MLCYVLSVQPSFFMIQSYISPAVLPQDDGKLPTWQLAVAATALFNTLQNFVTLRFTKRIYNNVPAAQPGLSCLIS